MSLKGILYRSSCPDGHGLGRNLVVLIWTQILLSDFFNAQTTPGLVLPQERTTGLGCIPEGRTVSYQCTVTDPTNPPIGSTIWSGSAFQDQCPSASNQINIPHSQFNEMRTLSCGTLMGRAVEVDGSNFVSQLNLTASIELRGTTLLCSLGGLSSTVRMDNISVGVIPPPPGSLMVTLTSGSILIISWSQSSVPVEGGLAGYLFGVTGEGCGCENMSITADTTCMTCPGWTAVGQTCSFEVRTLSKDCGFNSSPASEELTACDSRELGGSPSSMSSSGTADTSNGIIIYNGVVVGSVANLICNDGYIPEEIDSSNRSCMSNGKWSGLTQTCIALSQSHQDLGVIALIVLLLPLLLLSAVIFVIGCKNGQKYNPYLQATERWKIVGLSILTLGGYYFGMKWRKSDVSSKIWKKKSLRVYFMNPKDITKVKCRGESMSINTILAWARVWNLVPFPQIPHFEWTEDKEKADIRVNFKLSGSNENAVNWSIVGSSHEVISIPSAPTMELDLSGFSPHSQESIVIREFGHSLGLENEQQRGDFWDVIEDHLDVDQMKKDKGEFDFKHNLYRKNIPWELSVNYLTGYDSKSIMHCQLDMKWIKKLPTIINGNGDVKRKDYVKSFAEKCVEDHLPRQPSDKDYGRLIKAYGEDLALPNMVPSTETLQQAIQKARNCDRLKSEIWKGKKTLNVYFMYTDKIEERGWKCRGQLIDINTILAWARVWNIISYPNIPKFEMTEKAEEADIQVQFIGGDMEEAVTPSTDAGGIWSKLGMQVTTDNTGPKKKMTIKLNLADLGEQPELQESIVIKLFGHALGLRNEHQRSDFWNVIRKYLNVEKMKENPEIESAFENQWAATSEEQTVNSLLEYDPESITHFRFDMEWINIEFEESGTIDPYMHPLLSETEIKFLNGLSRRSQLGELPKRPSISDYEKLQAAYKAQGTSSGTHSQRLY